MPNIPPQNLHHPLPLSSSELKISCPLLFLSRSLPHSPHPARGSTAQPSFSLSLASLLYLTLLSESISGDDLDLRPPCPPFIGHKLLYWNRVKNSPTSPISKPSSPPTASSPSVASVPSSPVRSIKLHFHHDHHYRTLFFELWSYGQYCCGEPERSARSTFPDLINFRVARLNGFRRVFAHVAPIFFERGIAKPETKVLSNLYFNLLILYFSIFCLVVGKMQEDLINLILCLYCRLFGFRES